MVYSVSKIVSPAMMLILLVSIAVPVFALDLRPGTSKGQYVKYGNFVGIGLGLEAYNENDWMKYEVTNINGTKVTLLLTGQFKNGSTILGNGDYWTYDVETRMVNGTSSPQGPIIAGGLAKGDFSTIHYLGTINDTVIRNYLGVSREVNVLNYTDVKENSTRIISYLYDQVSGMLLEVEAHIVDLQPVYATRQFSYVIVDTNIFGPKSDIPIEYYYLTVAAIVASAILITLVLMKKIRKRNTRGR